MKYVALICGSLGALVVLLFWHTYTNDGRFASQVNALITGVLLFVAFVVFVALLLRYGLPAFWESAERWSKLQDAAVERSLKVGRYEPTATGMYALPAAMVERGLFLDQQRAALVYSQYEEPRYVGNGGTVAPAATLSTPAPAARSLPDAVKLRDYRLQAGNRFALGVQADGELLTLALPDVWHLLNNAQSGGGKSNNIDSFITQVHYLPHEHAVQMYGMDFKGELRATWKRSPLFVELATQAELRAMVEIAEGLVDTIHERNILFERYADDSGRIVKGHAAYTRLSGDALPLIYLVVDEMNALMGYAKKDPRLESALGVLLQMGRSAGVNVLMGAQHLTADVLPKGYYTNIATRVMLGAYDGANTTRLLGGKPNAESIPLLTGQPGRALIRAPGQVMPVPVQMLLVEEADILDSIAYAQDARGVVTVEPQKKAGTLLERESVGFHETPKTDENGLLMELLEPRSKGVPSSSTGSTVMDIPAVEEYERKLWSVKALRSVGHNKEEIIKVVWGVSKGRNYAGPSREYDVILAQLAREDI